MSPDDLPGNVVVIAADELAELAAHQVTQLAADGAADGDQFDIALAGGSTPRALYELLASPPQRQEIVWQRWRIWFGDERACPADDSSSNYAMARDALLDHVPVATDAIHRMPADRHDLDAAAAEYSALLARTCEPGPLGAPQLDCVLLGLGENGHTASLFPRTPALEVRDAWATRGLADYQPFDRITLTYPVLNAGHQVMFLVSGASKGPALRGVVEGTVPAAGVRPTDGALTWILDGAAAAAMGDG